MSSAARPQPKRGPSGPWSRLKPAPSDPLDAFGLPSKGETRLHDPKIQESYFNKIVERYMKFCASTGNGQDLAKAFASLALDTKKQNDHDPATTTTPSLRITTEPTITATTTSTSDLPVILHAMRKLREAILATRRRDAFAQRAYVFIIHAAILVSAWETYLPALDYLLTHIDASTPLAPRDRQEFIGYRVLDLACRLDDLAAAHVILRRHRRDRRLASASVPASASASTPTDPDPRLSAVLHALARDDWVRFWRLRAAVDGYQRAIMGFAVDRVREHALKCLGRSYMSADRAFVERSADAAWEDLVRGGVGWQLAEGGVVVVIRKPKVK